MSDASRSLPGSIVWHDLTVVDAPGVRDFYQAVVGWTPHEVPMGDYADFSMNRPGDGECVAGVCHARGVNEAIPPQWMMYVVVEDLDSSVRACREKGGEVIGEVRRMGADRYCAVRDPAGAVLTIYEKGRR